MTAPDRVILTSRQNPILAEFRAQDGDPAEWVDALHSDDDGRLTGPIGADIERALGTPLDAGDVDRWSRFCDAALVQADKVLARLVPGVVA